MTATVTARVLVTRLLSEAVDGSPILTSARPWFQPVIATTKGQSDLSR
jgi:hypothetical protein